MYVVYKTFNKVYYILTVTTAWEDRCSVVGMGYFSMTEVIASSCTVGCAPLPTSSSPNSSIEKNRLENHFTFSYTCTVPEFIDQVFAKTSPKRSFSITENDRFGLVFVKTGSINSGTAVSQKIWNLKDGKKEQIYSTRISYSK